MNIILSKSRRHWTTFKKLYEKEAERLDFSHCRVSRTLVLDILKNILMFTNKLWNILNNQNVLPESFVRMLQLMYSSINSSVLKIIAAVFLSILFTTVSNGQGSGQLKQQIQQALDEEKLTGAVWAVVNYDEEIAVDAAGFKNLQSKEQLKPTDKVHIGSVTKTILAVGVLRLISEGKINLNDPVEKYLPEINFDNQWHQTNPVTVRHLLDHTSGLEDLRLWQMFTAKAAPASPLSFAFEKKFLRAASQNKAGQHIFLFQHGLYAARNGD